MRTYRPQTGGQSLLGVPGSINRLCRVRCQRGARAPRPTTVLLFVNQFSKSKRLWAGTSGASTTLLVHVFMAGALPTYCLINEGAEGSSAHHQLLYGSHSPQQADRFSLLSARFNYTAPHMIQSHCCLQLKAIGAIKEELNFVNIFINYFYFPFRLRQPSLFFYFCVKIKINI